MRDEKVRPLVQSSSRHLLAFGLAFIASFSSLKSSDKSNSSKSYAIYSDLTVRRFLQGKCLKLHGLLIFLVKNKRKVFKFFFLP